MPDITNRGGVEDPRLEAKAKDTIKSKAKNSPSEDRPSRSQEQECSRSIKDQGHKRKCSPKKKTVIKKNF